MITSSAGPTDRFYESQGLRLHYADWGNDAAPLLIPYGQKLKLQESRVVIPSERGLAAHRRLRFFLNDQWCPSWIGGQMGGDAWSGHASWPTSPGRWTRSCCCGTNIWLLKTGF